MGWQSAKLGDVCLPAQYGAVAKGADEPVGPRFIRQTDIASGRVDWSTVPYCDLAESEFEKYAVESGDILVSRLGNGVGNAATVKETRGAVYAGYLVRFRPLRSIVSPNFVGYCMQSDSWRQHVSGYRSGAAQPTLNAKQMAAFELPLPPLPEQRAIAATLGALDDKIESNRRAQQLIEELVQAEFRNRFSVEQLSDGIAVSELIDVNPRRQLAKGVESTYVGMSSLPTHAATVDTWESKAFGSGQRFQNGDVLMARITPCLENGKTAVVDMLDDAEVGWGSTEYVVLAPKGSVSTPWIYCFARSEQIRAYAIRSMSGTSGRQRFQAKGFDKYLIAEPDEHALADFNAVSLPLFRRMSSYRDESLSLTALRDALLPELLSGRIRVTEAADAVAEATA